MKLLLLKCGICDTWYRPGSHSGHCPHCGSLPMKVAKRVTKYYYITELRAIEVVRSIPRGFEDSINCR